MRVLIADDHELLRDVLRTYLENEGGFEVATVGDLPAALDRIVAGPTWDVVLLDYGMPGMNGYDGMRLAVEGNAGGAVALISGMAPPDVAGAVLAVGASGYLPKTLPAKSFVNAIRFMAAGETYLPVDVRHFPDGVKPDDAGLSPREFQVLERLCAGQANKEIARILDLREPTVKFHVKLICRKLGARNRTHAAMIARERRIC